MENKYYTPKIEEFHVGFEFETNYISFSKDGEWTRVTLGKDDINYEEVSWFYSSYVGDAVPTEFRVKHLDREDIESLGFYQHSNDERIFSNKYGTILNTGWGSPVIKDRFTTVITHQVFDESKLNVVHENFLFNGIIKNKSELKRLLKQLGI